jgi:transposase-like protein
MEDRQPRNRRQFTAEFKRDAVELVRTSGRPIAEIARELGIYDSTLGNWVRQDRIDRGEQESPREAEPSCTQMTSWIGSPPWERLQESRSPSSRDPIQGGAHRPCRDLPTARLARGSSVGRRS